MSPRDEYMRTLLQSDSKTPGQRRVYVWCRCVLLRELATTTSLLLLSLAHPSPRNSLLM